MLLHINLIYRSAGALKERQHYTVFMGIHLYHSMVTTNLYRPSNYCQRH